MSPCLINETLLTFIGKTRPYPLVWNDFLMCPCHLWKSNIFKLSFGHEIIVFWKHLNVISSWVSRLDCVKADHLCCSCSVANLCSTLCDLIDCSVPGFPVLHQLLELAQTHVHWVSDASQPSHPLLSPSPPAFSLCQHQGLFQWIGSFHQVAKVLEFQLQHQSFQWIFRTDLLQDWRVGSPCSPRDSQESSPTLQFKSINSSALSLLHSPTLTSIHDHQKNHSLDWMDLCRQSNVSAF